MSLEAGEKAAAGSGLLLVLWVGCCFVGLYFLAKIFDNRLCFFVIQVLLSLNAILSISRWCCVILVPPLVAVLSHSCATDRRETDRAVFGQ